MLKKEVKKEDFNTKNAEFQEAKTVTNKKRFNFNILNFNSLQVR